MNKDYIFFPELSPQVPDIPSDSIVSRTLHKDEHVKTILFGFAPGQELSEHTASVPAIIQILDGEAEITLGADNFSVTNGAWLYMRANLSHSIHAQTQVKMLLIMLSN